MTEAKTKLVKLSTSELKWNHPHGAFGCALYEGEKPTQSSEFSSKKCLGSLYLNDVDSRAYDGINEPIDCQSVLNQIVHAVNMHQELVDVLRDVLNLPKNLEKATVPKAGIESVPEQVVFTLNCSYARLKKFENLLTRAAGGK